MYFQSNIMHADINMIYQQIKNAIVHCQSLDRIKI